MPPSGLAGSTSKYTLYGRNLPGGTPAASRRPRARRWSGSTSKSRCRPIRRRCNFGGDAFAEPTEFAQDAFAYRLQTPARRNQSGEYLFRRGPGRSRARSRTTRPQQAQKSRSLAKSSGSSIRRGDQDWYQFDAQKGDAWTIEVYSQRLGLSTDPYLLVQRVNHAAGGHEEMVDVAEADDPPPDRRTSAPIFLNMEFDDPLVRFVAPEDGTYRVMVRDLYGQSRGSPEYVYRLSIRRPAPDFRVLVLQEAAARIRQQRADGLVERRRA